MASVKDAEKAVVKATEAYNANKEDKSLKKALKKAKAALAAAQAAAPPAREAATGKKRKPEAEAPAVPETPEPAKKKKHKKDKEVSIESLQAAATAAKAKYKADKTIDNKAAMKAANAALEAAQAAAAPAASAPATPAAAPAKEETKSGEDVSSLLKLKSNKKNDGSAATTSAAPANPGDNRKGGGDQGENPPSDRVFAGNLSFKIDDDGIKDFFKDCGKITEIKWLEHKDTGKFKGCGILSFESVEAATKAVAKTGQDCLGRPISCQFSKPMTERAPGRGGNKGDDKPLGEKPPDCTTCFVGSISNDVTDDDMREFAKDCGEIKALRWLSDKETGEFRGCGFIEFHDTAAVDKFVLLRGESLKGRRIRIDYSAPSKPRR